MKLGNSPSGQENICLDKKRCNWRWGNLLILYLDMRKKIHCKKVVDFPVPSREVTNKISLAGNNLIFPVQGEFGWWHPGWGQWEIRQPIFTVYLGKLTALKSHRLVGKETFLTHNANCSLKHCAGRSSDAAIVGGRARSVPSCVLLSLKNGFAKRTGA